MTTAIGVLLLLIFALFAALMFLERLSALLALPLMAAVFVFVAVAAETGSHLVHGAAPATQPAATAASTQPPRFGDWLAGRATERELLARKAELFLRVAHCGDGVDDSDSRWQQRLTEALAPLAAEAAAFELEVQRQLVKIPDLFARPPHAAGYRAAVRERVEALPLKALLRDMDSVMNSHGARTQQLRAIRDSALRRYGAVLARHVVAGAKPHRVSLGDAVQYGLAYAAFVLRAGSLTLYATIIATLFGGMFAMYVKNLGIAERLVYWTAEFAGERPLVIAAAVFIVTGIIFTSVGGLGTVIMLGAIVLPVLRSLGISPVVGSGLFLMAIAAGGTLHPVSRRLWLDFYGIPSATLDSILWSIVAVYVVLATGWIVWGTRQSLRSSFQAVADDAAAPAPRAVIPAWLMAAPLAPVLLVYVAGVEEIAAFVASIAYMYVCVCRKRGAVRLLSRSLIEGAQTVVPPVLLMLGIGILVTALGTPPVQGYFRPLVEAVAPQNRWSYVLLFGLAAPLALYRGPLNVWGMGLAVSATLLATTPLPPAAILVAVLAAGMLQGICDPTNTANVWVAGFQGIATTQILRYTLLPVWIAAAATVAVFGTWFL